MDTGVPTTALRTVAMLGNHVPRQCGIATFTTDLSGALRAAYPSLDCFVLAMNDPGRSHGYPSQVRFEIPERDLPAYGRAADFLNVSDVDVVSVQHEYGIFGGKAGAHVLTLLRALRMPIVTTLHTILAAPDPAQRAVMDSLVRLSERLVVMSEHGVTLLREVHGVPASKIDMIPHGIPTLAPNVGRKDRLGVEGRTVILTFGLLAPDKGIEHVIDALPAIRAKHPDVVYIVLGATHPHVRQVHGETYRIALADRARRLGVDAHVIFHDRFVSADELAEFIGAADLYVTPYLKPEQITSGTLAYAVGCGKAVISTPYWYATELLAEGRGILVPWRDADAIADAANAILGDPTKAASLRTRAAEYGRAMHWPVVARRYVESFERARVSHATERRTVFQAPTLARRPADLPEVNLDHLHLMTDATGVLQHATFDVPNYAEGYCLDDNARALLLTVHLAEAGTESARAVHTLAAHYLAFIRHAFDAPSGRFRNFLSYQRRWLEDRGSEDSHGRALWALGTLVGRTEDPGRQSLAGRLFMAALPAVPKFTSPRAWAYALLGMDEYLRRSPREAEVTTTRDAVAELLHGLYQRTSTQGWPWFEDSVTYCNARLPQALIVSGARMANEAMVFAGLRSLDWLMSVQRSSDGSFAPIGSNGFYLRGGAKAEFDQQPVEACATVSACLDAERVTGDPRWSAHARRTFGWFLGQNHLGQSLYDVTTGGCRDGLHGERRNENQGMESTLSFLIALAELRATDRAEALASIALARRATS